MCYVCEVGQIHAVWMNCKNETFKIFKESAALLILKESKPHISITQVILLFLDVLLFEIFSYHHVFLMLIYFIKGYIIPNNEYHKLTARIKSDITI